MLDEPEEIKGIDLVKEKLSFLQLFCLIKKTQNNQRTSHNAVVRKDLLKKF